MIKEQSIYTIRLNRQFILLSHILKPLQEIWTKVSSDRDPCLNNKTKKIKKKKKQFNDGLKVKESMEGYTKAETLKFQSEENTGINLEIQSYA